MVIGEVPFGKRKWFFLKERRSPNRRAHGKPMIRGIRSFHCHLMGWADRSPALLDFSTLPPGSRCLKDLQSLMALGFIVRSASVFPVLATGNECFSKWG